jgi:hypothetical protein
MMSYMQQAGSVLNHACTYLATSELAIPIATSDPAEFPMGERRGRKEGRVLFEPVGEHAPVGKSCTLCTTG